MAYECTHYIQYSLELKLKLKLNMDLPVPVSVSVSVNINKKISATGHVDGPEDGAGAGTGPVLSLQRVSQLVLIAAPARQDLQDILLKDLY